MARPFLYTTISHKTRRFMTIRASIQERIELNSRQTYFIEVMQNIYKTYDYSSIPIDKIENKDRSDLARLSNLSIRELCKAADNKLLIFPDSLDKYKDGVADSCIFTIDQHRLQTGDLLGFIGINDCQLTISSRFAKNDDEDYFMHYMLHKVFNINLFNLQHSTSEDNIFDFLPYIFPTYLKRALRQGVYKRCKRKRYNRRWCKHKVQYAF